MSISYETQYIKALRTILEAGDSDCNMRTGVGTLRITHVVFDIDLQQEFPILKTKFVAWKSALKEILWIMQRQSNNINDLDSKIWDSWADESGSIGKAYGYQVSKPVVTGGKTYKNQVDYVLTTLKEDPSNRRCVIDLWNVDDLDDMNLTPCCYSSIWTVSDGTLNCMLVQRSADFLVGVPFNTTQYAMLTHLFAKHLGLKPGKLTHCMADAHIYRYESHIEGADRMIRSYSNMDFDIATSQPILNITDSDNFSFWDVKPEDITIDHYKYVEKIKFDVAV